VLRRFSRPQLHSPNAERRAQQLIAASFLLLAAYVGVQAIRTLAAGQHPQTSWVGIGLAAALAITAVALREARDSWRGEGCCDAC